MDDPNTHPHGDRLARDPMPPRPTWVKVFAIVFVVLAAAFAILHLIGKGSQSHLHELLDDPQRPAEHPHR